MTDLPDGDWRGAAGGGAPLVYGTARLAGMLYAGASFGELLDMLGPEPPEPLARAGWLMDRSWLYALNFSPYQAAQLQAAALALSGCFRVHGPAHPLRLLALCAPGDLMVNAPLDFIAPAAGASLSLAFWHKDGLPADLPEHDVAIVAVSESAPDALRALAPVYETWPRPILNNPALTLPMSRDWLFRALCGLPGVFAAPTWVASRADLEGGIVGSYPVLLRPYGSHAGDGLVKADSPADVPRFLSDSDADAFYVSRFVDYRGEGGLYAKYRIAFVDGAPFLCHMALSEHWMVHYLNAGMDENGAKRAAEQRAMDTFGASFAQRHRVGLAAVAAAVGLEFFSIDCAEAADGRLLVFEADVAAILHSMDPPELYPYKQAAMQRCYDAFGAMLRRRAGAIASTPHLDPLPKECEREAAGSSAAR